MQPQALTCAMDDTENSKPLRGTTILIMEDEPMIALDLETAFQQSGAVVTSSRSLKTAIIVLEGASFSAAVIDRTLPDGLGTDLFKLLADKQIPFVVYSGHGRPDGLPSTARHIGKPADTRQIVQAVVELLVPLAPT